MSRRKKGGGLKVRVTDNTAFVRTTDVRTQATKVFEQVLKKYPTVIVEKNGKPVAVLKRPDTAQETIRVEEF